MNTRGISVSVVGAGIGGLSAALSLLTAGFDVHVYERAATLGEVGAGIQVSPNASRVLHRLGLGETLARTGVKPLALRQRRWDDGRTLLYTPWSESIEAAFGFPYYQMHRADLLAVLAGAIPAERIHLGHRLIGLTDRGDDVVARFANGTRVETDVLVGADGVHSVVRTEQFGAEQDSWARESWTDHGDLADALTAFDGWHPQVRRILNAVDETFIWALFGRAPLDRWSVGRTTLLGDACHRMLPFMAQGAAQAIEDGATLTACLADAGPNPAEALRRYERLRISRTAC